MRISERRIERSPSVGSGTFVPSSLRTNIRCVVSDTTCSCTECVFRGVASASCGSVGERAPSCSGGSVERARCSRLRRVPNFIEKFPLRLHVIGGIIDDTANPAILYGKNCSVVREEVICSINGLDIARQVAPRLIATGIASIGSDG